MVMLTVRAIATPTSSKSRHQEGNGQGDVDGQDQRLDRQVAALCADRVEEIAERGTKPVDAQPDQRDQERHHRLLVLGKKSRDAE